MTAARLLTVAAAAAALTAGLLAPAASPAAAAVGADAQLVVAPHAAGIMRAGKPVDVSVTVHNSGTTRLSAGRLTFSLTEAPEANADALLAAIAHPGTEPQGKLTLTKARTPAIEPGATAQVDARITSDDIDSIFTSADGARLLYVELQTDSLKKVAESTVIRMSRSSPTIGLGTVIPITAPAGTTGVVDTAAQADLTGPDGEWSQALRAARAMPSAVVALDPAVLASVRLAADSAPDDATRFLDDLAALPNDVVRLPYADGDTTLQRAAGLSGSASPSSFTGVSTAPAPAVSASPGPTPAPTASAPSAGDLTTWDWSAERITWPVPRTTTGQDLASWRSRSTVLLGAADLQDTAARAAAGPLASVGTTKALVADTAASQLLATAAGGDAAGDSALASLAGALATDAVTRATPAVLAVPPRGTSTADLAQALGLLGDQRWIRGDTLAAMTGRTATAVRLRAGSTSPALVSTGRSLVQEEQDVQRLGATVRDAAALTAQQRLSLLGLLSAQWRADDRGWTSAATEAVGRFQQFQQQVRIVDPGRSIAGGSDGTIKVGVQNRLSQAVTVVVGSSVNNGRLRLQARTRITVQPGVVTPALVKLQAIANGPAVITFQLMTVDGEPIGPSTTQAVSVQAGVDTIVAVVLLTLLGLLLALGVYRNVTRRRRKGMER